VARVHPITITRFEHDFRGVIDGSTGLTMSGITYLSLSKDEDVSAACYRVLKIS
jgi:hypothetical protein